MLSASKSHAPTWYGVLITILVMLIAAPAIAQEGESADLETTVSDGQIVIEPGDTLTYTVVIGNRGPDAASGVQLFNALPDGTSYVDADPTQGDCSQTGGIITCDLDEIANGAAVRVLVSVLIGDLPETTVVSTFVASSATSDPDPMNNTMEELSSTVEVLPLTGAIEQVILPLAAAAIIVGAYLVIWSGRNRAVHAVRRVR